MKISEIRVYRKELHYARGAYAWGRGNVIESGSSTIVVIETDSGLSGCGEFCPCGNNYMVAHQEGTEAALKLLGPALIGMNPCETAKIGYRMDQCLRGHGYAKAALDAACWDLLGKATEQPLWLLLGGKFFDGAPMYRPAPQKRPDEMAEEMNWLRDQGYRQFQIKVGGDWETDIERIRSTVSLLQSGEKAFADANQGWHLDEALQVANATRDLDYVMEQPCQTYEECLQLRQRIDTPMKLDECVDSLAMAQRVVADRAAEYVCCKISNLGGLSKARIVRDYLVANRIPIIGEDTWGGEITTATLAHFAASTPDEFLVNTTDLHSYNIETTGTPAPRTENGLLFADDRPGHGVEPDFDSLGDPVALYQASLI
ncbi:MAG: enolase C-terminal domain-like protein [Pseudomonadota bacterium]